MLALAALATLAPGLAGCGPVGRDPAAGEDRAKAEPRREPHGGSPIAGATGASPKVETYSLHVEEPLFPGDFAYTGTTWNEIFGEPGESFGAYVAGYKRATAVRYIRIYPLGTLSKRSRKAMDLAAEYLEIAFSSEVAIMEPLSTMPGSYNSHYGQYDANAILNGMMQGNGVESAYHLNVAVTDTDLYAGKLSFVFGYADYVSHVAVVSLARLVAKKDTPLSERRLLKLLRHEIGHMYGMAHCTHPECIMRGANSREEADSIPLNMCPSCAAKLAFRIGDDGRERNEALAAFYLAHFAPFLEARLLGPVQRSD